MKYPAWIVPLILLLAPPAGAAEVEAILGPGARLPLGLPGSGRVEQVHVRVGDAVKAGTTLLCLDRAVARARITAARRLLDWRRQQLAEAQRELDRQQEMYDQTLLAEHDLQLARIETARAQALLDRARLELAAAERYLQGRCLQAPVAGRIAAVQAVPGQEVLSVERITPLLVLERNDRRMAHARLTADQAARLVPGQQVVLIAGRQRIQGQVDTLEAMGNGHWRVAIGLPASTDLPPAGTPLRLQLPQP
ncbi:MAG: biotin/lipoyl-binding protein [Gammaproteobacteria bacterium]|nr:MAG: biotin/lipoyl-binding protein [Gammaproteobacteria bacterium]